MLGALQDLQAVEVRQAEIQHQQIPVLGSDPFQHLAAGARLAGNAAVRGIAEKLAQAAAHDGMLVGDQNPEAHGTLSDGAVDG